MSSIAWAETGTHKLGKRLFFQNWSTDHGTGPDKAGLGPLFNTRSCNACHIDLGRGPGAARDGTIPAAMPARLGILPLDAQSVDALKAGRRAVFPDPVYGVQLQSDAVGTLKPEARVTVKYTTFPVPLADGTVIELRRPDFQVHDQAYGKMEPGRMISPRVAPPLAGVSLLASVPDVVVSEYADEADANGDGISGRPAKALDRDSGIITLGRFGWKAGQPTIRQQVAAALSTDIGISTHLFPGAGGDCMAQQDCRLPSSAPELSRSGLDALTAFVTSLEPPKVKQLTENAVAGKVLFEKAQCAACHRPTLKTGDSQRLPAKWRNREFHAYTDLLLHDLGPGLSDTFSEGVANFWEWRTPPLWGLSRNQDGKAFYLHDGRARSILEAILWHGGEAQISRNTVAAMTKMQREQLLAFLKSL